MRVWTAIWAIIRKDIGIWLRQPATIAATVLPALAFIIVIYVSAAAVGRNPVDLVALDSGPQASRLVDTLRHSDAFVVKRVTTPDQAQRDLRGLAVAAVITIPSNFDSAYAARLPDPVTIEINNLNLDFTNDLRRSLPAAITAFYGAQPASPIHVTVAETDIRAQDISLAQFELVPDLALLLTIAGVVNTGLATAREWEDATIKELLLAPISRTTLIAGKLLAGWLTTLLVGGIVLGVGAVTGALRPQGVYWLSTLLVVAMIAASSCGLGVALGAVMRSFQGVAVVGITLALYLFFLSGGVSVIAFLPDWVQTIAHFIPTFYGVHALQMAIFYNSSDQLGQDLLALVLTGFLTVTLGALALRRRAAIA
ncbi:MAG TPA: ABC transporter permease [Ktedonobacterales bacterium]